MSKNKIVIDEKERQEMVLETIKIMLRKGIPLEDIIHMSGKTEEEIKEIEKTLEEES